MSSEWPQVAVEEVCELIVDCANKTAPVVAGPTPFRMIRTTNVRNGRIDLSECRYVEAATYETWTRRARLKPGDVVLTREAPIGEVGMVTDADGVFLGQRLMQYRADQTRLDPRFLLYSFLSPALQHQFGSHEGSGSVVSHIRVGDCFKFRLSLPPLPVQAQIASLLGALDDRITLLRETNATLEAIAQALFKSWFVDFDPVRAKRDGRAPEGMDEATSALFPDSFEDSELGEVPSGWGSRVLGELIELTKGCSYKGDGLSDTNGAHMFNLGCFNAQRVFANDKVKRYVGEYKTRHEVVAGDLILANTDMTQARDILGRPAFVPDGFSPGFISHHVFKASVRALFAENADALRRFLFFALQQKTFRERAIGFATGTTVLALPAAAVLDSPACIPPDRVLNAFDGMIDPMLKRILENERTTKALASLRDTLLPRLISGQLRLPATFEEALA